MATLGVKGLRSDQTLQQNDTLIFNDANLRRLSHHDVKNDSTVNIQQTSVLTNTIQRLLSSLIGFISARVV